MATAARKSSTRRASAQKRAAQQAEQVARLLHSFAESLKSLDASSANAGRPAATPRNWWRVQAGRFKDDPDFPDFVARVRAARRQEG